MFALDTNILVYAHNSASPLHAQAKAFVERVMNDQDKDGQYSVCIPAQALMEFLNVITRQQLENPLSLTQAMQVVQDYLDTNVAIVYPKLTQLNTLLELLKTVTTRRNIFDAALAATLKDNGISALYTVNTKDFTGFDFLNVVNPLTAE